MRKARKMQQRIERMAKARNIELSSGAHFRVEASGFMDLVVKHIGQNQISVAHYYEQNYDLCQDPEIVFLVGSNGEWYPIEWTTPGVMIAGRVLGGYKRYVEIDEDGNWTRADLWGQRDLAIFANKWAENLGRQGFK